MAKSREKNIARNLRKNGLSLREIAEKIGVSKGSVSLWCSDIVLTKEQEKKLHNQMVKGSYEGRTAGARMQKERKQKKINDSLFKAEKDIPKLKERELFIAGLGLYWGEGAKKGSVRFYNSDPLAAVFMMRWFREVLKIEENRFLMYININYAHKNRLKRVIEYWSKVTCVPIVQFRKPTLINSESKKIYENFSEHYGTLCIRIARSGDLLYQIHGWIKAMNKPE